jgi:hypothetical protein
VSHVELEDEELAGASLPLPQLMRSVLSDVMLNLAYQLPQLLVALHERGVILAQEASPEAVGPRNVAILDTETSFPY